MRKCRSCGDNISDRGNRAVRCKSCQTGKVLADKRVWWNNNKDRYKNRRITRLGNPQQDDDIIKFLRDKKYGRNVPAYKGLPDSAFKYSNESHYQHSKKQIKSK